jgi:hypothetical protein
VILAAPPQLDRRRYNHEGQSLPCRALECWHVDVADTAQFRRSVKSEKHDSTKPAQLSIPQKDAIAIEPPKKVRLSSLLCRAAQS